MEFFTGLIVLIIIVVFMGVAARSAGARLGGDRIPDQLLGAFAVFFAQVVGLGALLGFAGKIGTWWYTGAAVVVSVMIHLVSIKSGKSGPLISRLFGAIPIRPLPAGFFLQSRPSQ